MKSGEWHAAWQIFEAARDLPSERQRAFVESESTDPEIVREVFDLLLTLEQDESDQPAPPHLNRTGTQVGRYRVGALLGRGGMGEVYAAQDEDLGRPVALKYLRPECVGDPALVDRFVQEAKAASALNHPNIVTIYEVIDASPGLAIAMELIDGDDLRSIRGIAQPAERVVQIGQQIARALAAAHRAGLIHRDIKPENILARKDGYIKIVDFGLALGLASGPSTPGVAGTLRYMSPEQARGDAVSPASDIFSLGLVLYEIAAGQHAFPGASPMGTMEAILTRMPVPPSSHQAAIPSELDRLILRMLAKDAAARPGAEEVAQVLTDLERAIAAPRAFQWARAGMRVAVVVLLAAGGFTAFRLTRTDRQPAFRQVTTLITENRATAAAISPDGKWTAYANVDGIFVRPIENDAPKPLEAPAQFMVDRLVWSADGSKLLASGFSIERRAPEIWMISAQGALPQLLRDHARGATLSRDETRIAFISADRTEIWTMDAGGAKARKVLGGHEELFLWVLWSPDGKRLAYQRRRLWAETDIPNPETDTDHQWRYESADVSSGRILAQIPGMPMATAASLSGGRIIFVRADHPWLNAGRAVWEVETDPATGSFAAEPRRIAEMHENRAALVNLSATADGTRIMVVKRSDPATVFVADFDPSPPRFTNVRRIIFDERTNYPHAWTTDSRGVIFESDRNGNFDLFLQYLDRRTSETIVATLQDELLAQLAPDGRTVLFALRPDPQKRREFRLMRVPLEGGAPEFVPIGGALDEFRCAVGGKRCVLRTAVAGKYFAYYELDPVRGKGRELARTAWSRPVLGEWDLSPDGTQAAFPNHYSRDGSIRIVSLEPDRPLERELKLPGLSNLKGLIWAVGRSGGWFVSADTDIGPQMWFVFPDGRYYLLGDIYGWAVPSPDGRHVAFENRTTASNAWVLER